MKIKPGYRIHVVDKDGVLLDTIELGGYNLDLASAEVVLVAEIKDALPDEAFEAKK